MKDLADYFYGRDDTEANKLTMKLIPMFTCLPKYVKLPSRGPRTLLIVSRGLHSFDLLSRGLSHYPAVIP